jgi:arsenical pump membrane protein
VSAAAAQAWPPFVLVAGLILVGQAAACDGVFDALGTALGRAPDGPRGLLLALGLTAATSAVLNLDTAAVFATPVLVLAARRRGADERPFLYGALFMANAGSLFLPGSNLTNLLVLARGHVSGLEFARHLLPAALASTLVTAAGLVLWQRRLPPAAGAPPGGDGTARAPLTGWVGPAASVAAGGLVVALPHPALPVLALGVLAAGVLIGEGRMETREAVRALGPAVLAGLFVLAVLLGTLARATGTPAHLMREAATVPTAAIGALAAVLVNNLPAAALLAAGHVRHPGALLVGLNVGPNLAVTGSLSSYLWWRSARTAGARPDARTVTRVGVVLAPAAIAIALLADRVFG